jgi:hypothetical protein
MTGAFRPKPGRTGLPGRSPTELSFHFSQPSALVRDARGEALIIEEAWNEYRGWAKRTRALQTSSRQWSGVAFACAGLAAILGAAAIQVTGGSISGRALAFLAAVAAAIAPILGRERTTQTITAPCNMASEAKR